jgi:chromate reductase
MKKILIIVGSLRKDSYNKKLAVAVEGMLGGNEVMHADISQFPLFNEDLEKSNFPESVMVFKKQIESADGIIFVTAEYNRSIPGPLKNAIDWGSRPDGQNSFKGKHVYTMGVSSGKLGTVTSQHDLKRVLNYFDCKLLGQPELYLGPARDIFDEAKNTFTDKTLEFVKKGVDKFVKLL